VSLNNVKKNQSLMSPPWQSGSCTVLKTLLLAWRFLTYPAPCQWCR